MVGYWELVGIVASWGGNGGISFVWGGQGESVGGWPVIRDTSAAAGSVALDTSPRWFGFAVQVEMDTVATFLRDIQSDALLIALSPCTTHPIQNPASGNNPACRWR